MQEKTIRKLVAKYKKIKAEKKAAEREARIAKKKAIRRDEVMKRRSERAKEHRRVVMYYLHLKRLHKSREKAYNKIRRRRAQHKYYIRHIKRPYIRRRLHHGDELGRFIIFFAKNRQYDHIYAWYQWRFGALEKFDKMVEQNHAESICPAIFETKKKCEAKKSSHYEILVKKKIDPNTEINELTIRDAFGSPIVVKTDDPEWVILKKEPWYIEETFYLYGYHPIFERKEAGWIIDNIIKKYAQENYLCRIFMWKSYVFFENDSDFTFLLAKSSSEANRLYNILFDRLNECEDIYFTGSLSRASSHDWVEKMKKKTGWKEETIRGCTPVAY